MIIDADAHVVETERTWEFMDPADQKYRPQLVKLPDGHPTSPYVWIVDGKVRVRQNQTTLTEYELAGVSDELGRNVVTAQEAREMWDVGVRIKHMDQLGIDVEVLHNSFFIRQVSFRPEAWAPICRGYNRWLADIWRQGKGRLRWTLVAPLASIPDALDEIRFGKEHGAVGLALRGLEGERTLVDPYFYPLYEEALKLVISHQQASASLLQRRLKVGYARAGRLIDELEMTGIIGPFDGGKARHVLVDESYLEEMYGHSQEK